jgi:hypothetical protein
MIWDLGREEGNVIVAGQPDLLEKKKCHRALSACCLLLAGFSHDLWFDPEYEGSTFLQNISGLLPDYMALHTK